MLAVDAAPERHALLEQDVIQGFHDGGLHP